MPGTCLGVELVQRVFHLLNQGNVLLDFFVLEKYRWTVVGLVQAAFAFVLSKVLVRLYNLAVWLMLCKYVLLCIGCLLVLDTFENH